MMGLATMAGHVQVSMRGKGSLNHLRGGPEVDAGLVGRSGQHVRLAGALAAVGQHACIDAIHDARDEAPHLAEHLLLPLRMATPYLVSTVHSIHLLTPCALAIAYVAGPHGVSFRSMSPCCRIEGHSPQMTLRSHTMQP